MPPPGIVLLPLSQILRPREIEREDIELLNIESSPRDLFVAPFFAKGKRTQSLNLSETYQARRGEATGDDDEVNSTQPRQRAWPAGSDEVEVGSGSTFDIQSSFLGRVSSHSLPSSHKKGASTTRSFVFGRDDSNSRSSISMSEDSSDAISGENRSLRNAAVKFRSSQSKISTQSPMGSAEAVSGASLFDILKRSSMQSNICNQDTMVGLTQTVFASFKISKKPSKIEGRI